MLTDLLASAAWRFVDAVDGFEVVHLAPGRLRGHTSAVEDGRTGAVRYEISRVRRRGPRDGRRRARAADTSDGDVSAVLTDDDAGLVVDDPGIARRAF